MRKTDQQWIAASDQAKIFKTQNLQFKLLSLHNFGIQTLESKVWILVGVVIQRNSINWFLNETISKTAIWRFTTQYLPAGKPAVLQAATHLNHL